MKSKAYWVKRAVEVETYLQSQADSVKDGVIKAYERAIKNVNNDIEKTFKAYISTDIPEKRGTSADEHSRQRQTVRRTA